MNAQTRRKQNTSITEPAVEKVPSLRLVELELQEAYVTFRAVYTLLVQGIAALLAANVVFSGYALACAQKMMIPILFTALTLQEIGLGSRTGVITNLLVTLYGKNYVERLLKLNNEPDIDKRKKEMLKVPLALGDRGLTRIFDRVPVAGHIILSLVLWRVLKWPLF